MRSLLMLQHSPLRRGVSRTRGQQNTTHNMTNRMRVRFLLLCMLCAICAVLGRLWYVQILHGEEYRARAQNQYMMEATIAPHRGTVYFRDHGGRYPVAINKSYDMIFLVPRDIRPEDHDRIVTLLHNNVGDHITDEDIRAKMRKTQDPFEVIAHRVEKDVSASIREARIPGVQTTEEVYRYYPAGDIAAHVIGFVGSDGNTYRGRYGIEASLNDLLAGKQGFVEQVRDAGGRWIPITDRTKVDAEDGVDVVLTIDYSVQYEVERILRETVEKHGADRGSIIAMRPDGAILAMASWPSFDPNDYRKTEDIGRFVNPIVSHVYEAGSVVKPITVAIGVDANRITPETTFTDTGFVQEAGYTIRNAEDRVYGLSTMTRALEESINTGMIFIERLVGHEAFASYMELFGFGQKTGIALPGEASGSTRNLRQPFSTISFYTASFGQGINMTVLQLAQAYAAIANGGTVITPRIVDRYVYHDGREEIAVPEEKHRVIRPESAEVTRQMLENVVIRGHGKRAAIPGYRVGGKTGTAQVPLQNGRGYEENVTVGSFAGIAPVQEPAFVVVVRIDNPKDVRWAESTAAPAFQRVMKFLLEYYSILPTEDVHAQAAPSQSQTQQKTHD